MPRHVGGRDWGCWSPALCCTGSGNDTPPRRARMTSSLSRLFPSWLSGSAEVSYAVFELLGGPVYRTGFIFALPGLTIEVAKECSGIRSSLALLITSLLAGHLFLRSAWTKAVLTLATLPLLIVKNGIRIVTLSLLSIYVDPSFLTGSLHRDGGIVFFFLALVLLTPVLWLLQTSERTGSTVRQ